MLKYKHIMLLIVLGSILFLPGIQSIPILDRDSAHFAQATRQMLQTEDFFQVKFQEKTRFQKPPGINWLQALSVSSFSNPNSTTVWPYRLPSVIAGILSVLFCFLFARKHIEGTIAFQGAMILACSFLLVLEGHMAVIDTNLLFSVVLMQGALWQIYSASIKEKAISFNWVLLFWLAMSWGIVLKGVTPLVGFLTLFALSFEQKNLRIFKEVQLGFGLLLVIGLILAWLIPMSYAENTNYLLKIIQKDLLPKLQGGHESHGRPIFFHLISLPLTFWPMSLFLLPVAIYCLERSRHPKVRFLLAWFIPTWLFFDLMPTKLPQYVLPMFPPLALLVAMSLNDKDLTPRLLDNVWFKILGFAWLIFSIALGIITAFGIPYVLKLPLWTPTQIALFLGFFLTGLVGYWYAINKAISSAVWGLVISACITYAILFNTMLPQMTPLWLSKNVYSTLKPLKLINSKAPLLALGYHEPSLVFYFNTKGVKYLTSDEISKIITNQGHPQTTYVWLTDQKHKKLLLQSFSNKNINWSPISTISGFNYSNGKKTSLFLYKTSSNLIK